MYSYCFYITGKSVHDLSKYGMHINTICLTWVFFFWWPTLTHSSFSRFLRNTRGYGGFILLKLAKSQSVIKIFENVGIDFLYYGARAATGKSNEQQHEYVCNNLTLQVRENYMNNLL
jgi:hypothetical protein